MKVYLDNIGKIVDSTIALDGLTVITGHNNTGKSTILKSLYSITNQAEDYPMFFEKKRIIKNKHEQVLKNLQNCFQPIMNNSEKETKIVLSNNNTKLSIFKIQNGIIKHDKRQKFIYPFTNSLFIDNVDSIIDTLSPLKWVYQNNSDTQLIVKNCETAYNFNTAATLVRTVNKVNLKQKNIIDKIMKRFSNILPQNITFNNKYYLVYDVKIDNISNGAKIFLIIKMLLEQGFCSPKTILMLDNPDNSLHPKWQIVLAEIFVLLVQEFKMRIVLTTNSLYFLNAVEVYGKKYKTNKKINFYLMEDNKELFSSKDITNNMEAIYKTFMEPLQQLEDIQWE